MNPKYIKYKGERYERVDSFSKEMDKVEYLIRKNIETKMPKIKQIMADHNAKAKGIIKLKKTNQDVMGEFKRGFRLTFSIEGQYEIDNCLNLVYNLIKGVMTQTIKGQGFSFEGATYFIPNKNTFVVTAIAKLPNNKLGANILAKKRSG